MHRGSDREVDTVPLPAATKALEPSFQHCPQVLPCVMTVLTSPPLTRSVVTGNL